ncbi:MAG: DNA alkylation repair protein [Pseudomonadota bacterium]|nr:DNA alkylation repair protein [Pseudomonadota bacterium]
MRQSIKNHFQGPMVMWIAHHCYQHFKGFDQSTFVESVMADIEALTFKQRVNHIAKHLAHILPKDHKYRHRILLSMLHPNPEGYNSRCDHLGIRGWGLLPLTSVVGQYGLEDIHDGLNTLKIMTNRFTAEYDVRPFIVQDQDTALSIINGWCTDSDHHVRRLASESTRPRLPWAQYLPNILQQPLLTQSILEQLKDDPSPYVRRSVANHLNDHAKRHPDYVHDVVKRWLIDSTKARKQLCKHACRNLIKQGHPQVLACFDIKSVCISRPHIQILNSSVGIGQSLVFSISFVSTSDKPQDIIVDYVIYFKKKQSHLVPKIYKWKKLKLKPNTQLNLSRQHVFRQVSSRVYHTGKHALAVRINGQDFGYELFELKDQ